VSKNATPAQRPARPPANNYNVLIIFMILIACCIGIGAFAYINHQKEIAHQLQQQQEAERLQKQQE